MQEPERTFQSGRRYVLGQGEDFYGIWDRGVPGKPVETFPLTDSGLREAQRRISKLAGQDFWARVGPRGLRWALFGGLAVWILAGLVIWIRFAAAGPGSITPIFDPSDPFVGIREPGWLKVTTVIENVAFRLWIAAVAILVALRLFDRSRPTA